MFNMTREDSSETLMFADIVSRLTLAKYIVRVWPNTDSGEIVVEAFSPGSTQLADDGMDAEFYVSPATMQCEWASYWDAFDDKQEGTAEHVCRMLAV